MIVILQCVKPLNRTQLAGKIVDLLLFLLEVVLGLHGLQGRLMNLQRHILVVLIRLALVIHTPNDLLVFHCGCQSLHSFWCRVLYRLLPLDAGLESIAK